MSPHPARGFTLIEVAVTALILGLLATVAVPLVETARRHAQEKELRDALWQIRTALDAYKLAWDQGHIVQNPGDSGYPPTLATLVEGVEDQKHPVRRTLRFLRRIPRDPFNRDLSLTPEQTWGLRSYHSSDQAPEAGEDVFDVYPLETGQGSNGIPYRDW